MREPLPVLLFALIALVTRESLIVAAAAGVFVNAAIVVAVFFLTRELANTRAGLLAALLWACYVPPVLIFYAQPSGDLLATLATTLGVFHYLRARRTGRRLEWIAAGVWLGLGILSRSAVLIIAVVLSICQVVRPEPSPPMPERRIFQSLRSAVWFVLAWALIASPWYIRNYVVFGRPVIGSTLSGYYLYRQNYTLPTDHYLRFVSGGEFVPVLRATIARRSDLRGTENEAEMDQVYRQEAARIIKAQPRRYLALTAYRFLILWFNWGVPEVYHQKNTAGDYLIMLQHALLLVAAALGVRRRWRRAWPLAASVVAFSLAYMAVMSHVTYVVPVVPILVALGAIAIAEFVVHVRTGGPPAQFQPGTLQS
jgi:4-amino-4-deoxy-L-arabinose transferase-like glycosyltransferase